MPASINSSATLPRVRTSDSSRSRDSADAAAASASAAASPLTPERDRLRPAREPQLADLPPFFLDLPARRLDDLPALDPSAAEPAAPPPFPSSATDTLAVSDAATLATTSPPTVADARAWQRTRVASAPPAMSRSSTPVVCACIRRKRVKRRPSADNRAPAASQPYASCTACTRPYRAAPNAALSSTPRSSSPSRRSTADSSGPTVLADVCAAPARTRMRGRPARTTSRRAVNSCLPV